MYDTIDLLGCVLDLASAAYTMKKRKKREKLVRSNNILPIMFSEMLPK